MKTVVIPFGRVLFDAESTKHFFLHCHYYRAMHISFLNYLNNISPQFALLPEDVFVKTLLFCQNTTLQNNSIFDESENQKIRENSIRYILDSKRLSEYLS